MTSYQKLSDSNDRNAFPHGSGGQSPKSRCRRGHVLSETFRGESIPCLRLVASLGVPWLVDIFASVNLWNPPCVCSLLLRTSVILD